ncbi:hypothetical protein JP75_07540 [Devosia riboflavina]|uniref:Uncharacterized protein n=2 Tax=Devosia riboflavina TaxID=46914 RepID=A0A087M3F5_9HYPH|nr:hypothetical protein JP75_07540 [Devosia riboflavina]
MVPAVLVRIDQNSCLSILQDEHVQVVLLDERVVPEFVTLLPRRNQAEELLLVLGDKYPVSLAEDQEGTAANALAQLYRRRILVGSLEPSALLSGDCLGEANKCD